TPVARANAGKAATGTLEVRAYRRGGQVRVEVRDDGRGISADTLRESAVRKGFLTAAEAARLDDGAALDLIYVPGFSTSAFITATSGRGVGMDAVKAAVHK